MRLFSLVIKVKEFEQREKMLTEEKAGLRNKITSLENELKITTKTIREREEELSEVQEQIISYSETSAELQNDREEWKSRTLTLQDDIRKTKTFVSSKSQLLN